MDLSLDDFEGLPAFRKREESSKDIKKILANTVLSSSSLSKSLKKLDAIGRNMLPSDRNTVKGEQSFNSTRNSLKEKISLRERTSSQF